MASSGASDAPRYLNRELSWLRFNSRVLEEAARAEYPILERVKFLAIFESNLDEFYMVRVSGLIEQHASGLTELTPDGLTPSEQLEAISDAVQPLRERAAEIWTQEIQPELTRQGIKIREIESLSENQRSELESYFLKEVFPLCTPLVLYPNPSVPFISNRSLNLGIVLEDDDVDLRIGRVKVPTVLPRLVRLNPRRHEYVWLEDVIIDNLGHLFPGVEVQGAYRFRVIRDADIEIRELEAADLISSIEQTIKLRRFGDPVLLEVSADMPERVRSQLMRLHELDPGDVIVVDGLLGLDALWEISRIEKSDLRFPAHQPAVYEPFCHTGPLLEHLDEEDLLVHHPFDSFRIVETFASAAAHDPSVVGIKQTLYRVGSKSPIVESLLDAAENGKQVAAMVELKARFDESNNLVWARALERAGVHVTYGFYEMKVHCKLCLLVRRTKDGMHMYAHVGTGNYNPVTAKIYTDLGLFTSDPEVTQDVLELFNFLTGFSRKTAYRKLLVAPINLREGILERIEREIERFRETGRGHILFKLNALVDPEVIDALYEASQAGVPVDLIVRGICCLRPGVPGLSENIRVISVVGRFLEHSRIYYFNNGGQPEALIGSADLMRRNLDRRIEVLVPVRQANHVQHLRDDICEPYLRDTTNAWELQPDGSYVRRQPNGEEKPMSAQNLLIKRPSLRSLIARDAERGGFSLRV